MLQIISGKFYTSDNRHQHDAYTPLYSNYFWPIDVELEYAKLLVDSAQKNINSYGYVFYYLNQIDTEGNPNLIRIGDHQILQQFQNICVFGLQAIFDSDERVVADLCKPGIPFKQNQVSSELVKRYFNPQVHGNIEEIEEFKSLFKKIIDLSREDYKIIIKCIEAFTNSLKILEYNFDLAYSMLIYCLETLSQNFDGYEPVWSDYEKASELDVLLRDIDNGTSDKIRNTIIKERNFKLSQRFIKFIIQNTNNGFFTIESVGIERPLRRSEFEAVLKNAYKMRSSYAHSLQPILEHIKNPQIAKSEIFTFSNQPYFTYDGLLRLTHHIMKNIIFSKEVVEKENINWLSEIPGQLIMEWDPKYWIWRTETFDEKYAKKRLSGFLDQFFNYIMNKEPISYCKDLMSLYESKIFQANKTNRNAMAIHYLIYNQSVPESDRSPNLEKTREKINKNVFTGNPCIESLIYSAIYNQDYYWTLKECEAIYEDYRKKKSKENSIILPQLLEIILLLGFANKCISEGHYERYEYWINLAYLESSGLKNIQNEIDTYWCKGEQLDTNTILNLFR